MNRTCWLVHRRGGKIPSSRLADGGDAVPPGAFPSPRLRVAPTWKGLPLPHSSFRFPHSRLSPASPVSWSPSPACGDVGSRPQRSCFSGPVSIIARPSSGLRDNFPVPHKDWRPGAGVSSPAAATE